MEGAFKVFQALHAGFSHGQRYRLSAFVEAGKFTEAKLMKGNGMLRGGGGGGVASCLGRGSYHLVWDWFPCLVKHLVQHITPALKVGACMPRTAWHLIGRSWKTAFREKGPFGGCTFMCGVGSTFRLLDVQLDSYVSWRLWTPMRYEQSTHSLNIFLLLLLWFVWFSSLCSGFLICQFAKRSIIKVMKTWLSCEL